MHLPLLWVSLGWCLCTICGAMHVKTLIAITSDHATVSPTTYAHETIFPSRNKCVRPGSVFAMCVCDFSSSAFHPPFPYMPKAMALFFVTVTRCRCRRRYYNSKITHRRKTARKKKTNEKKNCSFHCHRIHILNIVDWTTAAPKLRECIFVFIEKCINACRGWRWLLACWLLRLPDCCCCPLWWHCYFTAVAWQAVEIWMQLCRPVLNVESQSARCTLHMLTQPATSRSNRIHFIALSARREREREISHLSCTLQK